MRLDTKEKEGHNLRSRGDPVYTHTHSHVHARTSYVFPIILTPVTSPPGDQRVCRDSYQMWPACSSPTVQPREVSLALSSTTCTEIPPPGANNEGIKQDERRTLLGGKGAQSRDSLNGRCSLRSPEGREAGSRAHGCSWSFRGPLG